MNYPEPILLFVIELRKEREATERKEEIQGQAETRINSGVSYSRVNELISCFERLNQLEGRLKILILVLLLIH